MFYVKGGIYTDFSWTTLEPGTEECYGPFATRAEAFTKWRERIWANVDTACHRVQIVEEDSDGFDA